jgi:UDP-N-acetylmuramoyl-L-alanyl-D-glutamate--2,6-diaminopimelate ligase
MMPSVTLQDLLRESIIDELRGGGETVVTGVQHDSRQVGLGDLFVAVPGQKHDGAAFAVQAASRGASAIVAEQWLDVPVPVGRAGNARRCLALAASRVYGDPTSVLRVVGVTGTNGKTSVTQIVAAGLQACGAEVAHVGTLGMQIGSSHTTAMVSGSSHTTAMVSGSSHTTPEADDLMRFARQASDSGCTHLVMEVSSHALALHRVDGVHFEVAAFTNLSQDHLDFHGTMLAYGEAKARLFESFAPRTSVINIDDEFGRALAERLRHRGQRVLSVSTRLRAGAHGETCADIQPIAITHSLRGIAGDVVVGDATMRLASRMVGAHNVQNLLVALGCLHALGVDVHRALRGIESFQGVPGRLERVSDASPTDPARGVQVFVDYAHTPDALTKALSALRPDVAGRLWVVFGAGGDRDPHKRPLMGRAAATGADLVMLTDDNPRTEDPASIVAAIERGVREVIAERCEPRDLGGHARAYAVKHDRRQAIRDAIQGARAGDVVVIAGKGHETYQIVGTRCLPLDDRHEARLALQERGPL